MKHATAPSDRARCQACDGECRVLLDAGRHPVANHFVNDERKEETTYPLVLGQCRGCGLIQLMTPVAADALVSPYDWITYNEPEPHLDAVVETLVNLPGFSFGMTVAGVTYKDDSTLARLHRRGVSRRWRIDPVRDLGIATGGRA